MNIDERQLDQHVSIHWSIIRTSGIPEETYVSRNGGDLDQRLFLVHGPVGFFLNNVQEKPWFTHRSKHLTMSPERMYLLGREERQFARDSSEDVRQDDNMHEEDDVEYQDLNQVLVHDLQMLVQAQRLNLADGQLDLGGYTSRNNAARIIWISKHFNAVPLPIGHGWNYWLKPHGSTGFYAKLINSLNGGLPRGFVAASPREQPLASNKRCISYVPLFKALGAKGSMGRDVVEQFCGTRALFGALWVHPSCLPAEIVDRLAEDWNLKSTDQIVEALSSENLTSTPLFSLSVPALDTSLPPAAWALWDMVRSLALHPSNSGSRIECRVSVAMTPAKQARVHNDCNPEEGQVAHILRQSATAAGNRVYHNRHPTSDIKEEGPQGDEEDDGTWQPTQTGSLAVSEVAATCLKSMTDCFSSQDLDEDEVLSLRAVPLTHVLQYLGWSIQYFCWAIRHVLARWISAQRLRSINSFWHCVPRSIIIALHLLCDSLQCTLTAGQPLLVGEGDHWTMSEFSLWWGLPQIQYVTGTSFCGSLFKVYRCLPTQERGQCPYDGCLINVDIEQMPAKLLELKDRHVPVDCCWADEWISKSITNPAKVKALSRKLYEASYGGQPGWHLISDIWSSLSLPPRWAPNDAHANGQQAVPVASAAPPMFTLERVIR
jgi:hypothetical protein